MVTPLLYPGTGFLTALGREGDKNGTHPGESVVWQAGQSGVKIVVDVGGTVAMGNAVAMQGPAIVVLTHDDSDHIGGWDAFWSHKQRPRLYELWVPYEWGLLTSVACDLLLPQSEKSKSGEVGAEESEADPDGAGQVESDPNTGGAGRGEMKSVSDVAQQFRSESRVVGSIRFNYLTDQYVLRRLYGRGWDEEGDAEYWHERDDRVEQINLNEEVKRAAELIDRIKKNEQVGERLGQAINEIMKETDGDYVIGTPKAVAGRALDRVATTIRILANVAESGGRIRLFSTEAADKLGLGYPWQREGFRGLATVPNAREVELVRTNRLSAYRLFAYAYSLSVQNRRALSVLLWTDRSDAGPKAMVWSDTSGEWTRRLNTPLPIKHIFASTAPHHGSDGIDHSEAWAALWRVKRKTVFVCAGGSTTQEDRVHGAFLAVPLGQRACTRCRHLKKPPKPTDVEVFVGASSAAIVSANACTH